MRLAHLTLLAFGVSVLPMVLLAEGTGATPGGPGIGRGGPGNEPGAGIQGARREGEDIGAMRLDILRKELDLTDDQVAKIQEKIKAISDEAKANREEFLNSDEFKDLQQKIKAAKESKDPAQIEELKTQLREKMEGRMKELREKIQAAIKEILNDEQKAKFNEFIKKSADKRDELKQRHEQTMENNNGPNLSHTGVCPNAERREQLKEKWESMTDEEKAAFKQHIRERMQLKDGDGPEPAILRQKWEQMTDDERAQARDRIRERIKERRGMPGATSPSNGIENTDAAK